MQYFNVFHIVFIRKSVTILCGAFFLSLQKYLVMQLKIKTSILRGGKRYDEGDKIDLPDHIADNWISRGYASPIIKKQSKAKIETKELKVEQIETKDDATS